MDDNTKVFTSSKNFHLAGIVPIAGRVFDFNMDWHDSLFPISPNYTLLDNAIVECAWAGCDTIWVICHSDTIPLVRYRIGDYVNDPVWANRAKDVNPSQSMKRIPIFWCPIHPKDKDKRDCLGWSVIHGALQSLKVSTQLSKWIIPDKYYVSFPYGVFDPEEIRPYRKKISSPKNFYVLNQGKTAQDNHYTSFTFGKDEFIRFRKQIRKGTGMYSAKLDEDGIPRERLPVEQRWSARFFELKDIFIDLDINEANVLELAEFHNIASWDQYREYLKSPLSNKLRRPAAKIFKYSEFNKIGCDRGSS